MNERVPIEEYRVFLAKYLKRERISLSAFERSLTLLRGSIQFIVYEAFTVALLLSDAEIPKVLGVGVSQRNHKDKDNVEIGRNIALWRAFDNYYTDEDRA